MQLEHIEFSKLKISRTNMRYADPPPDVSDILPSIRAKGLRQPMLVRSEGDRFGVVAGRRRWFSLKAIKEEFGAVDAPPCAIMEEGDDADAIEASLLENVARRDPDPMREYETFARLIKEGAIDMFRFIAAKANDATPRTSPAVCSRTLLLSTRLKWLSMFARCRLAASLL